MYYTVGVVVVKSKVVGLARDLVYIILILLNHNY
jgi:hypothetical protein